MLTEQLCKLLSNPRARNLMRAHNLLRQGADPNVRCLDGETPLHVFVMARDAEGVRIALRRNADIHVVDDEGVSPLELAWSLNKPSSFEPDRRMIRVFKICRRHPGIDEAAIYGRVDLLKKRLSRPIVNNPVHGRPPLLWAIIAQQYGSVATLLAMGQTLM